MTERDEPIQEMVARLRGQIADANDFDFVGRRQLTIGDLRCLLDLAAHSLASERVLHLLGKFLEAWNMGEEPDEARRIEQAIRALSPPSEQERKIEPMSLTLAQQAIRASLNEQKPPLTLGEQAIRDSLNEEAAQPHPSPVVTAGAFKCKAREGCLPDPQDCGWPICGCDPYAESVIEALGESGMTIVPDDELREALKAAALSASASQLREALERAKQFLDPSRDPPRLSNREAIAEIDAALARTRTALRAEEGQK